MTEPPAPTGGYEVIVARARSSAWAGRVRAAGRGGGLALVRLRRWLGTPQGRRTALRIAQGLSAGVLLVAGGVTVRRVLSAARGRAAGVVTAARRVAAAAGALGATVQRALSLRWLSRLLGVLATPLGRGAHTHCVECHARIRTDARVCFRCRAPQTSAGRSRGHRSRATKGRGPVWTRGRTAVGVLRWGWRVATLSLYHRCPDCRRGVHVEARRCYRCGATLD